MLGVVGAESATYSRTLLCYILSESSEPLKNTSADASIAFRIESYLQQVADSRSLPIPLKKALKYIFLKSILFPNYAINLATAPYPPNPSLSL